MVSNVMVRSEIIRNEMTRKKLDNKKRDLGDVRLHGMRRGSGVEDRKYLRECRPVIIR